MNNLSSIPTKIFDSTLTLVLSLLLFDAGSSFDEALIHSIPFILHNLSVTFKFSLLKSYSILSRFQKNDPSL